jgi:hypothetical protein
METDVKKPRTLRRVKRSAHTTVIGNTVRKHSTDLKYLNSVNIYQYLITYPEFIVTTNFIAYSLFPDYPTPSPAAPPSSHFPSTSVLQTTKLKSALDSLSHPPQSYLNMSHSRDTQA